jgi:hypothetical protein
MIGLSCKEASRLISAGMDGELTLGQRTGLRLHLLICAACSRVKSQLAFLRRAAPEFPGPAENDAPRDT